MPRTRSRRQADEPTQEVAVSGELFAPVSPGVELCYQTFGDPDADPLLLVMGLGGPMTWWPDGLCTELARAGFYVIRYDNRDTGRSTRIQGRVTRPMIVQAFLGRRTGAPYRLEDMAADGFGLLDHLGLASANVTGVSMGGMIAQEMAIAHPERVRSLVSIMSTTGRRTVGWQDPRILPAMLAAKGSELEEYVAAAAKMGALIGSPGYPEPVEEARARAEVTHRRGLSGSGVLRHMLAVLSQKDRAPRLRELNLPAAVIHGMDDRMVHPSGGRATAQALRGANLLLIPGMGHDLPTGLWGTYTEVIRATADRAK
ncbi:alpha/beta fold hydrolase [Nocardioides marmorisolisilvae]|uniref:Alpha/beta hydrolase n=1 Tax=Nocardioides marmorisolisilvae TaxID=1542737 RepID=A0A3N0DZF4_9ACTN|nr:alpha/beta hydrolase [Nocardioides marmorisolisilvae]RNL80863.1 alpha/beta hydrolase [Nocardioides marmorisolisilvae]